MEICLICEQIVFTSCSFLFPAVAKEQISVQKRTNLLKKEREKETHECISEIIETILFMCKMIASVNSLFILNQVLRKQ